MIIPLLSISIIALANFFITPSYQASTTLILTKTALTAQSTELDYNTVLLNKQLLKTYQELAKSRTIIEKVRSSMNAKINVEDLKNMINVELVGDTGLIRIKVENGDPQKAALIANTLGEVFVKEIPRLMKINNVEIVDRAQTPKSPIKPNIKLNLILAGIAGFLLSLGLVFLLEYLDNTFNTTKDVEKNLALPTLGTIPINSTDSALVTVEGPHSVNAEAYRVLKTNLVFLTVDKSIKTLLVTSASAQEGKSTISANLGIIFAQGGNKVIIIDADLRLPSQHKIFGLLQRPGLTNVALDEISFEKGLQKTKVPGLSVLSTGPLPPNPAELLGSLKMKNIIAEAQKNADIVIIDSAPVVPVIDAAILANVVDGTLLILNCGKSRTDLVKMAKEQILKANARILGTVLNGVTVKSDKGYRSYYGSKDTKLKHRK